MPYHEHSVMKQQEMQHGRPCLQGVYGWYDKRETSHLRVHRVQERGMLVSRSQQCAFQGVMSVLVHCQSELNREFGVSNGGSH
jgi:hypothetical protein